MLSKNELKYYSSLLRKKERETENKFIAEGKRIVEEGLKSNFYCEIIIVTEAFLDKNQQFLNNFSIRKEIISENEFRKLSDTENPQGILGVFHRLQKNNQLKYDASLIVLLENISDPGNAGTILRNCDWFGASTVIFNDKSVEPYNPKVVRSSMGSLFHLLVLESKNLSETINELKQHSYWVICADMDGKNLFDFQTPEKTLLILSSEAFGPSDEVIKLSDAVVTIPRIGSAESLNVASASAVILSHLTKNNLQT